MPVMAKLGPEVAKLDGLSKRHETEPSSSRSQVTVISRQPGQAVQQRHEQAHAEPDCIQNM